MQFLPAKREFNKIFDSYENVFILPFVQVENVNLNFCNWYNYIEMEIAREDIYAS